MNTPDMVILALPRQRSQQNTIKMKLARVAPVLAVLVFAILVAPRVIGASEAAHEVWMLDQSNTFGSNSGGTLYIFDGNALAGQAAHKATPEVISLGGSVASWVLAQTGSLPVRPHYLTFNASGTHAIISFVATGHVMIIEAA